jgi:hypothetical protein
MTRYLKKKKQSKVSSYYLCNFSARCEIINTAAIELLKLFSFRLDGVAIYEAFESGTFKIGMWTDHKLTYALCMKYCCFENLNSYRHVVRAVICSKVILHPSCKSAVSISACALWPVLSVLQ